MTPSLLVTHWHAAPGPDAAAALACVCYLIGVRRIRRGWPVLRTVSWAAGLVCLLVALQSGVDGRDDQLLSVHMVQHLLLLELAPLLLLGGHPGMLLLRACSPARRPAPARWFRRLAPLGHPLVCLCVVFGVVALTHLPAFYDATLRHPALHDFEHLSFVGAGIFMWWPLVDADPIPGRRLNGAGRLVYVIAAMLPMTVLGAYLDRDPSLFYAAYAAPARSLGVSAVVDQQQAGAIMWVLGSSLMVVAGLWQAMAALIDEERRLQSRERRLERGV